MAEPTPEWLNTLTQIGTALGLIGGSAYAISRKLSKDNKDDVFDEKTQGILDNVNHQLKSEREENHSLREAIERVASERNALAASVGEMKGHIEALEHQVQHLSYQVEILTTQALKSDEELRRATLEMRNMHATMANFFKQIPKEP